MKRYLDEKFKDLTEPKRFEKIIAKQKIFPLEKRKNFKKIKIKILKSFKDRRSYSLTAVYTIFLNNGQNIKMIGAANSDGKKFYSYHISKIAWKHFKNSQKQIVDQPIAYLKKYGLFLKKYITGKILADDIKKRKKLDIQYVHRLLKWLNEFQKINPREKIKPATNFYDIEKNLKILKERNTSDINKTIERFKKVKKMISCHKPNYPKPIHGDLNPLNIILTKNGLAVVDFDNVHCGDPLFDIAAFCAHLLTLPDLGISRNCRIKIKNKFFQNYEKKFGKLKLEEKKRFKIYSDYFALLNKTHKLVWG